MQLDFRQILNGLRKRWWLAVLVALSAAAVAYLYTRMQPSIYQSQVTMVARPVPLDNGQIEAIIKTLPTYAQELGSKQFQQHVIDTDMLQDIDLNALNIAVQSQPAINGLVMTVNSRKAETAALVADRLAAAFVESHNAENQDINPGGYRTVWTVTQEPTVPDKPFQPRPNLYAGAAGLFGLIIGLLLAVALELLDTTLKTPQEVDQYLHMNTLGVIPRGT